VQSLCSLFELPVACDVMVVTEEVGFLEMDEWIDGDIWYGVEGEILSRVNFSIKIQWLRFTKWNLISRGEG
jgi:hypothetical protein